MRWSESLIPVRIGVAALSSLAVTTAGTLRVIKRNFHGTNSVIWRSKATVSTLAITTVSYLGYDEDHTTDNGKATQDRSNNDGSQVAFDLTGISETRKPKEKSEVNVLG